MNLDHFDTRARRFGTTGFIDFSMAFFDQRMRLLSVEKLLDKYNIRGGTLYDFGCGRGDFLTHLANRFDNLWGYDPCVPIAENAARRAHDLLNIDVGSRPLMGFESLDVILSITVFQHIHDSVELATELRRLYQMLKPGGLVIALESITIGDYFYPEQVRARPRSEWVRHFRDAGFKIFEQIPFFNAIYAPTESYRLYRRKTRLVSFIYGLWCRWFGNTTIFNSYFERKAREVLPDKDAANGFAPLGSINDFFILTK
jgi:2-polyprenyl-3-methyl-5-hydroxy-6-metoxy-1,4-benzoquinol methylase